jgi:hypothetical protein
LDALIVGYNEDNRLYCAGQKQSHVAGTSGKGDWWVHLDSNPNRKKKALATKRERLLSFSSRELSRRESSSSLNDPEKSATVALLLMTTT